MRREELVGLPERAWRELRGTRIGLIPQDPTGSLDPVRTIGASVGDPLRIHGWRDRERIEARVIELLERVGLDDPATRARQYPHELSGGMRQRVLIAAALALEPELLIADEPTSALDVTVQATVLDLIDELRLATGAGVLLITHRADTLVVLRGGTVEEAGPTGQVLAAPSAEYTRTLLSDAPSLRQVVDRATHRPGADEAPLGACHTSVRVSGSVPARGGADTGSSHVIEVVPRASDRSQTTLAATRTVTTSVAATSRSVRVRRSGASTGPTAPAMPRRCPRSRRPVRPCRGPRRRCRDDGDDAVPG